QDESKGPAGKRSELRRAVRRARGGGLHAEQYDGDREAPHRRHEPQPPPPARNPGAEQAPGGASRRANRMSRFIKTGEEAIAFLLERVIGEDVTREGLLETPKRVTEAWREWTQG